MKRLIVYDLDGTLVDTLADIAASANHALQALHAPPVDPAQMRGYVGRGVHDLMQQCLKTHDARRIDEGVTIFRTHYAHHLVDRSRLYPGARELLEQFRSRQQAVITNKPDPFSRQILEALGVAGYFLDIIAGGDRYPHKPDPASLLALMEHTRTTPEQAVFIGDSPIDIETGKRAGVSTLVVTHGFVEEAVLRAAEPDGLVRNFAELLQWAKEHQW